ncbi:MAG: BREX system P-loop protein BrxC, partial [Bacteroidetes bacterium]|nr:BREX system P-loop protein BrxC [Bacteroidota bacterium]
PACFKGNRIQQLKTDFDALKKEVDDKVKNIRESAENTLEAKKSRMQSMDEYKKLPDERTAELLKPFQDLMDHIHHQNLIAVINDRMRFFEDQGYQVLLAKMVELATPKPDDNDIDQSDNDGKDTQERKISRPEYISVRKINVAFSKALLTDETDVESYLESMREALLEEIRKGKRIQI